MPDNSKNYQSWLQKAEEDKVSAEIILKEKAVPSTVCFLSQQMAEKYLKGLLIFYGKNFPKVHDLFVLETLLLNTESNVSVIHPDLKFLNRFYIETRYPDFPEFTWKDAEEALRAAKRIKKFVLGKKLLL